MQARRIQQLVERITSVLRSEERKVGRDHGLQGVHLEVLRYLRDCNEVSNTPAAVGEYLGTTKGTVSQTLKLLERKGLVLRRSDAKDRRLVRLELTPGGTRLAGESPFSGAFGAAVESLGPDAASLERQLETVLRSLQRRYQSRSFGTCPSCLNFRREGPGAYRCMLTGEPLQPGDTKLLCREHDPVTR